MYFTDTMAELEKAKRNSTKGGEYWMGRDMQKILGYATWENFYNVIQRARMACESAGVNSLDHFLDVTKKITAGPVLRYERQGHLCRFVFSLSCLKYSITAQAWKGERKSN